MAQQRWDDLQAFLAQEILARLDAEKAQAAPGQTVEPAFLLRRQHEPRELLILSRHAVAWVDATVSLDVAGWKNDVVGLAVRFYAGLPLPHQEIAVELLNAFGRRANLAVTRQADLIRASSL